MSQPKPITGARALLFDRLVDSADWEDEQHLRILNQNQLRAEPLILEARQRRAVKSAIRETCQIRGWTLHAMNPRRNHVHAVVSANRDSDGVLVAFKANATRELRERGLWRQPFSPWARKGSGRHLWNERSVAAAIDYVLNGQGDDLPDFDD